MTTPSDNDLNDILGKIARCPSLKEAQGLLDKLSTMQEDLCKHHFRDKHPVSELQWYVIRRFDRGDDSDLRDHVYRLITDGLFHP